MSRNNNHVPIVQSKMSPLVRPAFLSSRGRGRRYSLARGLAESFLRVAYRSGWPARLWGSTPKARHVDLVTHTLPLLPRSHPPLRLAFAADLHLGPTTAEATLDRACELIDEAQADVVLLALNDNGDEEVPCSPSLFGSCCSRSCR